MRRLCINFLANGLGLAGIALVFRVAFWGEAQGGLWWFTAAGLALLWLWWLIEGALLLVIGWQRWRGRRAR